MPVRNKALPRQSIFGIMYNKSKTNPQGKVQMQLLTDHSLAG
jgi:hypothetical protein